MNLALIVNQYKSIVKCLALFGMSVLLYLLMITKFSEWIFVNPFALYLLFAHYLILLGFMLFFAVMIGVRLMKVANALKQEGVIKINTLFILLGYVLCLGVPVFWVIYLVIFWILGNKLLRKT